MQKLSIKIAYLLLAVASLQACGGGEELGQNEIQNRMAAKIALAQTPQQAAQ